jgi:hypothetical protein
MHPFAFIALGFEQRPAWEMIPRHRGAFPSVKWALGEYRMRLGQHVCTRRQPAGHDRRPV